MHILMIGMGDTGFRVAQQLQHAGHRITGVKRTQTQDYPWQMLYQSATNLHLPQDLPPIDRVLVILSPDTREAQAYRQTFLDTVQPIFTALKLHPIDRVILVSSTSVYGEDQGQWVDEYTPPDPKTPTSAMLWQAEQAWRAAWGDRLVVVRPSGIYGPDRLRLIRWVQSGKPVSSAQWTNRIHIDDLTQGLARLADIDAAYALYIATDQTPVLQHQLLEQLAIWMQVAPVPVVASAVEGKRIRSMRWSSVQPNMRYPSWSDGYQSILPRGFE